MFQSRGGGGVASGSTDRLYKKAEEFLNDGKSVKRRFQSLLSFIGIRSSL